MGTFSSSELAQLKVLEDEVNSYLKSKLNNPKAASGLNHLLARVIPNTLLPSKKVSITWNDDARTPFIMSITPDIGELYKKSEELNAILTNPKSNNADFLRKWAEIKEWHIEIDTRVLTKGNRLCVDEGRQFVALLCHEVGHVMTESPIRLVSNYKLKSLEFSMLEKLMLSNSKILRAIMLPMYTHTLQFFIVVRDRHDQKACEFAADAYVPDEYKGALVSYMNDHLLTNPEGSRTVIDASSFDKEQMVGIELSKESVEMLKGRRELLKRQIQAQYNAPNSSPFHKNLMKFIGKNLTGYDPETDKYVTLSVKSTMESAYIREYDMQSAAAVKATMEATKVSSRDLDILEVQIDDVKTPEDKMYMIHKLYDYIEILGAENAKLAKNSKKGITPDIIKDDRLDRLNSMRIRLLNKDVTTLGDKYGVFVKYPAGYEG